ncbi:MAG: methionyl-tRNA formyltransferase [Desulfovermiculus sp.]
MAGQLNVIFMGTPEFAATILGHLLHRPLTNIQTVITQPDRVRGRGRKLSASPVKIAAEKAGLSVWQPSRLSSQDVQEYLSSLAPDFLLVAAYGLILPSRILNIARYGALNVHASLLPKYRGAAPIQRALADGEPVTGISIMSMRPGLDCGPLLMQRALAIDLYDTAATLHDKLAQLGGECLIQTLNRFQELDIIAVPQDESQATYAPKLSKEEGRVIWNQPARKVHDHIRAMHPWPGAFTNIQLCSGSSPLTVHLFPGQIGSRIRPQTAPGTIEHKENDVLRIACSDRYYLIQTIKPSSRRAMSAASFSCGYLTSQNQARFF